ncbi:MAG TPA: DoxX family membrane protein [Thermoflexales bacterium]|nr:DoxX family membrane protein [Thermoflexales bacterium]HQW35089.1 DoxX family membrane protein [Thermoflexales bacterium]HQZ22940.1 DoxX family membrane protein [Thermoflexales bacterium]HQZ99692.1 DoxX family membrane protein [Thermoflexales bacterium]
MFARNRIIEDPPIARFLFNDTRSSILWLVLRVWLGLQWWDAGLHKVQDPAWAQTGTALQGFWTNIVKIPATGKPVIAFDWYRDFIQGLLNANAYTWFGPLVAYGEMLIAIGLIIGAFVGIAAFFGAFMNWNFIMAGSASSNGLLMALSIPLTLAWKVAGYIGADYFLLKWLGVPWRMRTKADDAGVVVEAKPAK